MSFPKERSPSRTWRVSFADLLLESSFSEDEEVSATMVVVSPSFLDEKKKDLRLEVEEGDEKLNGVTEEVVAETGVTEARFANKKEDEEEDKENLRRRLNFGTEVLSI